MLYLLLLSIVLAYLAVERGIHELRLRKVPLRIHVNGTRGKTSVTRLTAELFRRAGIRTLAKTTGDRPVLILPDGSEIPIRRRGPARIREQAACIRIACREGAEAAILECMAIDPDLQEASERGLIRSRIGVITNVRPDHFEVMGKTIPEIRNALGRGICREGVLVTGNGTHASYFRGEAERLKTGFRAAGAPFRHPDPVLSENLALVREVGLASGLRPDDIDAILSEIARGERAYSFIRSLRIAGSEAALIDAFSANDTISAECIEDAALAAASEALRRPFVAFLNARSDRPLRTIAFADFIKDRPLYDAIALAGSGRFLARRRLRASSGRPVHIVSGSDAEALLTSLSAGLGEKSFTLFGLGNYKGAGEGLRLAAECGVR
jgi:poly-gamma-glutamate synthase PgsB/CapB